MIIRISIIKSNKATTTLIFKKNTVPDPFIFGVYREVSKNFTPVLLNMVIFLIVSSDVIVLI